MFGVLGLLTLRQWRSHSVRVILTTLGIALGVAVFFAVRTANVTLLDSLAVTVQKLAGKSTLQVTAGESGFPEQMLDVVRRTPGVQLAEPVIEVIAHTSYDDEGNLLILGVDTTGDQQLRDYEFDRSQTVISDPITYLAQPNSLLLSRAYADRHSLKIGDELNLFTSLGQQQFTVQGIFQPVGIGDVFGGNIAVMDVYSAQKVFGRGHNIDRIDLMNAPSDSVDAVQQRLRGALSPGIEVQRPEVRGQGLENAVTALRLITLITSFIALLVGTYIIFNSFTIAVNQRWKEIGILRSVGVERRNVLRLFLGEAALMGVIGSLAGIAAGYYLAYAAGIVMGNIAATIYGVLSTPQPPTFRLDFAAVSLALGMAASLLGAWFPARAASQLDPIQALHNIEVRRQEAVLGWPRTLAGVAILAASALLIRYSPARVGMTLQLFYPVLTLAGLTILLPKLVHSAARLLRPAMDWAAGSEGALAVDSMIQSPRRSSATVGALMVGLMFVFSTGAYIQSFRRVIDRWTGLMVNSDIIVATSTLIRSPTYHFSEDLGVKIAALPGVKRVENVRFTAIPYRGDTAALVAEEMAGFLARARDAIEEADAKKVDALLPRGEGILVSRNFSARWQMKVGDHVHLDTPTGPLDLPILGIVEDYRSEKGVIFLDRAQYKKSWGDNAVDFVDVNFSPGADSAAIQKQIEQLTSSNVHALIYTNAEFKRWIAGLINQFFMLNYMQLVVAILVAVLGIVNTLVISVSERRREIGILRALGGLRSQVRKVVLLEAVAISIVGVFVGALASVFAIEFMSITVSMVLAGYNIPFYFPVTLILLSLPVVLAASLAAGWWPARSAVRMNVIEAIGYE